MSKQPSSSQASAPASIDLVKRLEAAGNDAVLLREIIESNDSVSVTSALAALPTGGSPSEPNSSALRKKALNRPCRLLPAETFLEVVLFADRNTLDTMQLVCSFLVNFVKERELTQLALRAIPWVSVGGFLERYETAGEADMHWIPIVDSISDHGTGKDIAPESFHHLTSCLRMAFCESVSISLADLPEEGEPLRCLCDIIVNDLVARECPVAPNTFVGTLILSMELRNISGVVARVIKAFKLVKNVFVEWDFTDGCYMPVDDDVLVVAAQDGVRHFEWESWTEIPVNTAVALSFGFAEPAEGGDRSLLGVECEVGPDFLAQIKRKVAQLDGARHVDFNFKLTHIWEDVDSSGFDKYQRNDELTWLVNDLENRINVEIKRTKNLVEIHVFSRHEGAVEDDVHWLPIVDSISDHGTGKEIAPKSLHDLASCLRLAFCESVWIFLEAANKEGGPLSILCDMVFRDLVAPDTYVGTLTVTKRLCNVKMVARSIDAFRSVKTVNVEGFGFDNTPLGEYFLVAAARHGVRHIKLWTISGVDVLANAADALSFGFADPTEGGDRSLIGVACDAQDFLAQIKQKVAQLGEVRNVNFTFKLANISANIDSSGFEMYQRGYVILTWFVNDLENRVNVEIKQKESFLQTRKFVEIHVFSSA